MDSNDLFKETERLIYQQSWKYSRKYEVDFEEVKSEAFYLFCRALEEFDSKKSSFSTFLYHYLRRLDYFCVSVKRELVYDDLDIFVEDSNKMIDRLAFHQTINELSENGKKVVKAILRGEFRRQDPNRKLSKDWLIIRICKDWKWKKLYAEFVYKELTEWWKRNKFILES